MKTPAKKIPCKKIAQTKLKKIIFEFTSPGTPQQNGIVERVFYTFHYWMRAIMLNAVLHENLKDCPMD